jgi:hypothetical protein
VTLVQLAQSSGSTSAGGWVLLVAVLIGPLIGLYVVSNLLPRRRVEFIVPNNDKDSLIAVLTNSSALSGRGWSACTGRGDVNISYRHPRKSGHAELAIVFAEARDGVKVSVWPTDYSRTNVGGLLTVVNEGLPILFRRRRIVKVLRGAGRISPTA